MSDRINLSGKNIIVDSVEETDGSRLFPTMLSTLIQTRTASQSNLSAREASRTIGRTQAVAAGVGARKSPGFNKKIDIFAYNPLKTYNENYSSDYYVSVGYVSCAGSTFPVDIPNRYSTFSPDTYEGVWAICVYKPNELSEAYSPLIAYPHPSGKAMLWYCLDEQGNASERSSTLNMWVLGLFNFTEESGVYNLSISSEGVEPQSFLTDRFLQIIGDAADGSRIDFTNWAVAIGCDAIFKRLAALEVLVNNLYVNNITVGADQRSATSGLSFKAHNSGGSNGEPLFDVYFNDVCIFKIYPESGNIFFGEPNPSGTAPLSGFMYKAAEGSLIAPNGNFKIDANGSATMNEVVIKNGYADFGSILIAREAKAGHAVTLTSAGNHSAQAKSIWDVADSNSLIGRLVSCTVSTVSAIKYAKALPRSTEGNSWTGYYSVYYVYFYDSSQTELTTYRAVRYTGGSATDKDPFSAGTVVTLYDGGNILTLKDIPTSSNGLATGRVWNDNGTLKIVP